MYRTSYGELAIVLVLVTCTVQYGTLCDILNEKSLGFRINCFRFWLNFWQGEQYLYT
jgi:hypothetical protein